MDHATLQLVRSAPLFSALTDAQLGCIEPGEVIEASVGTVLVVEGERSPFFFVVREGEIRLSRNYDRQSVLMGVIKPGKYTGEVTLLLDIPGSLPPEWEKQPNCSDSTRTISGEC